MSVPIGEEHVTFRSGELTLAGVLAYPEESAPRFAALLCAPHPNFAGNMENNVIVALARDLARDGMTLRFDYRGVGASEIRLAAGDSVFDYWNTIEETQVYRDPLADVAAAAATLANCSHDLPLVIAGYSFGAILGLLSGMTLPNTRALAGIAPPLTQYEFGFLAQCRVPCLLVSGQKDFVYVPQRMNELRSACVQTVELEGEDHFFRGSEEVVCGRVRTFFDAALNR